LATPLRRRLVGAVSAVIVSLVSLAGVAGPAHAEDGFQYWNYFHLQGGHWAFSDVGTADYQPKDGTVEGFRYGTSTGTQGIEPRADLDEVNFDTVCAGADTPKGEKAVAVVLDFGTEMGNGTPPKPRADCAVVPQDATTSQILQEVAEVRVESGMTCALDGYPASGCGVPVKNAKAPADEENVAFALPSDSSKSDTAPSTQQDGDTSWPLVGLAALAVLIAGAAVALTRRGRTA
jgi:hypothetical protein